MMISNCEFASFRYAFFAALFVALVSARSNAGEKPSIDSMIRPGVRITWSQRGFDRPLLHQLLVVKTDGQTFKGFFRGSYRQFAGEAPPAFTHAEGYISNGLIVFTVNGILFDKGIERAFIR